MKPDPKFITQNKKTIHEICWDWFDMVKKGTVMHVQKYFYM